MKLLISIEELSKKKSRDLIPCECELCKKVFYRTKNIIQRALKGTKIVRTCSHACSAAIDKQINTSTCLKCGKQFNHCGNKVRKFCSKLCANIYLNPKKNKNIELICRRCGNKFVDLPHKKYCSVECKNKKNLSIIVCKTCGKKFYREFYKLNRSKHGNNFCSKSCQAIYSHKFFIGGSLKHRSRAEFMLIDLIKNDFNNLNIVNNSHSIIPSGLEIDIFIPELKLGIELNGPFHYVPIFGQEKLDAVRINDKRKIEDSELIGINLMVLDISRFSGKRQTKIGIDWLYFNKIKPIILDLLKRKS